MSTHLFRFFILAGFIFSNISLFAQGPDCAEALTICSDGQINFTPSGAGINDFADPDNFADCLFSDENQSAWYYFEFQPTMPANSIIEFTINPNGGAGEDYDFAIYGPNVDCDNLGFPLRCSYASSACSFCPATGLGNGATDTSEPASGDGYVSGLEVQPGEGFFLVVDNWLGSSTGFSMDWGGSAAPFLNCDAVPGCELTVEVGPDVIQCVNAGTFSLSSIVSGNMDPVTYSWTGSGDGTNYLSDPTSPNPTVNLPLDFEGTIIYTLVVEEPGCQQSAIVTFSTLPSPVIQGDMIAFCFGETETIGVPAGYQSYLWSTGESTNEIEVEDSGTYTVTITNDDGCSGETDFEVTEFPELDATIVGESDICPGGSATFGLVNTFANYAWSTGDYTQTITVYSSGFYAVTVAESNNCMTEMFWEVTYVPFPQVNIDGPAELCDESTAELIVDPGFAGYYWENGEEGQILEISEAGFYEVTIVDADGCVGVENITVEAAPTPDPMIQGDTIFCAGDSVILTLESSYETYEWSDGTTIDSLIIFQGGEYTLSVASINGCTASDSILIIEDNPIISIFGPEEFCAGDTISLQVDSSFVSYLWSDGSFGQILDVDTTGIYSVAAINENACLASDTLEVEMNLNPTVTIEGNLAICPNGATTLSTDSSFSEYIWSVDSIGQSIIVNTPGFYAITVTDENGCLATDTTEVIEEAQLSISIYGETEICEGTTTILGLNGVYDTYSWSTGSNTPTIETGMDGTVSVSVTDEYGCFGETSIQITVNALPEVVISGENTFCEDSFTVLDGGVFSTYLWQDSSSSQQLSVDQTGTYSVTVTDSNGCMNSSSIIAEALALPVPEIFGELAFCPGTSNLLTGEDGFIGYDWGNGQTEQEITIIAPGTYVLNVEDVFGCQGSDSIVITNFLIEDPIINGINIFCPGESTSLEVEQSFMIYDWSSGDDTQNVQLNTPGIYGVTVTDVNGCLTNSEMELTQFSISDPQITGPPGLCIGESTQLLGEGGFLDYQWDTGNDTSVINVGNSGVYTLSVTDSNGCMTSSTFDLPEFNLPEIEIIGSTTFCIGNTTTLGSSAIFDEYNWSTGSTNSTIQVSIEDSYFLTVTDANGCMNSTSVDVIEATELSPVISGDLFYCETFTTTLDVGAGFATYLWSDNSTGQTLTVDQAGVYSVSVTDSGGCAGDTLVVVVENPLPQPTISGALEYCFGTNTILDAGSSYQTYLWSTGEDQQQILVNTPGDYLVTVTNQFGCEQFQVVEVLERPLPVFSIVGQDYFCEGTETNLSVDGQFNFYSWSIGGMNQTVEVNTPGMVGVTVTNEFDCQQYEEISIQEIPLPLANSGQELFLDCEVREINLQGGINNNLGYNYIYNWVGPGITMDNQNNQYPEVEIEGLYALVIIDEDHNCQSFPSEVILTDLAYQPDLYLEVQDTLDCITDEVRIDAITSVTGPGIQYQWFDQNMVAIPGANNDFYLATSSGEYFFEIIDDNTQCRTDDTAIVEENDLYPVANAGAPFHLNCITTTTELDGTNSQQAYYILYQWQTSDGNILSGANGLSPLIDAPGIYELIVTDTLNGCENISDVLVTEDIIPPDADAGETQQLDCHNESVTLTGNSATSGAPISFQWTSLENPGQVLSFESVLSTSQPGTFNLLVANLLNGCENNDLVFVDLDDSFPTDLDLDFESPTCFGDANGALFVEGVSGGAPPLLYSIDGESFSSSSVFNNLSAGEYNVIVQDVNGCEYEETLYLGDGNDLLLDLGEDIFIDLGESADVNAYINLDPEELVSISWQLNDSINCLDDYCLSFEASPFSTQSYSVTILDENGCLRSDEITIFVNKPRDVFIPNVFSPNGDGNNDIAMIFAGKGVVSIHSFLLFNRWGEIVFEGYDFQPNNPDLGWDGRYRGAPANSAVFTYFAEIEFIDGEVILYKGDITLIK
jgi:gliding motility-associated-like protein